MTTTTAWTAVRTCTAVLAVVIPSLVTVTAGPALAHSEGLTPYRYVVAPRGVVSEGPAQVGVSTQPIGAPGFAGTTDNQMQLTLPAGALPPRAGERAVRVQLDQLDPASLPALPNGLEPEGNGYRVAMAYAASGTPVPGLGGPASLGLSAPAAPSAVYRLDGLRWDVVRHTPVAVEEGFTSVVTLDAPGVFLQAYDPPRGPAGVPAPLPAGPPVLRPAGSPPSAPAAVASTPDGTGVAALAGGVATGAALLCLSRLLARRRRAAGRSPAADAPPST